MYTLLQFEASRGGVMLPVEPAKPTPIAFAVHVAAFVLCVPFAGCTLAWSLYRLVLA